MKLIREKNNNLILKITIFVLISLLLLVFISLYLRSNKVDSHKLVQIIDELPGDYQYILFTDISCGGISDFGWTVFEISNLLDIDSLRISCEMDTINLGNKYDGINLILSNYSEDGSDIKNPEIEVIDRKFLIFSRGGYRYGLYDLETKETLFNLWSPWGKYQNNIGVQIESEINEIIKNR